MSNNERVGLPQELVARTDQNLSSGTIGTFFPGLQLNALANGTLIGFNGSMLYPDTIGATLNPGTLTAASLIASIGSPTYYHLIGEKGYLRAGVSSVTVAGVTATNGIYSISGTDTYARGVYRFQLGDVDDKSSSTLDQGDNLNLPVDGINDWEVNIGIAGFANLDQAAAIAFAEFGLVGGAIDDDPANAIATKYIQAKIAASKITFSTDADSLNARTVPDTPFSITFRYFASSGYIYCEIDGQDVGQLAVPTTTTALQFAARVCHGTGYLAASHDPAQVEMDYLVASKPLERVRQ